jgi:hypothetical protein
MALVNKNQPMREAEIEIADFINNRLTNIMQQIAIPGENSIALEQLDDNVKRLQTIVTNRDVIFEFTSDEQIKVARVTVKNNQEAIPGTDWKYVFNGAFASLNGKYNDNLVKNPLLVNTAIESVNDNSVTIAVVLVAVVQPPTGTSIHVMLNTIWNCMRVDPK